ncbi:MAG: glycosyltransferase family 39 protein [Chloroflexota bacterium]
MNDLVSRIQSHRALALILAAFLALATIYSIVTPIFEAGDELWHYPFVQHLATGHGLPVQDPNVKTLWEQEGGQPPLYYALSALATFWIDTRDLPDRLWRNPHARIGIPLDYGNKNMIVHTSAENFPWQNTTLAVHLIRFLSILLSTITVTLTYFFALEISNRIVIASGAKQSPSRESEIASSPPSTPLRSAQDAPRNDAHDKTFAAITAALVAFNPMFLFISASVNNDNLATMLATLALLLLAQLITRGATTRRFVALGIVLGLGALTKVSLLGLLIVAACVFAYLLWKSRGGARERGSAGEGERGRGGENHPLTHSPTHPFGIVKGSLTCAALVVLIAFWWYARNWMLYGDFSAFDVWVRIAGGRPTPVTLANLLDEFQGFRISFWGNFGGVNLIAPEWVYLALDAFTALALIGLFIGLARRALPRLLWLPALWLALISLALVRWTWMTMASQGRLIFPAIAAVAVLLTFGLGEFKILNSKFKIQNSHRGMALNFELRILNLGLALFLLLFAILTPFTLIAPTYALPARFADEAAVPNPVHITFAAQAELVGYALPQTRVAPGGELPLTIYWRAREPIAEDFSVYVRLFDANDKIIARWDAFPGGGLYPTRVWPPGEVIADEYRIPIPLDARAGVGRIEAGLFRRVPLETLTARDPRGNIVTPTIARFKIVEQTPPAPKIENAADHNFGDQIALVGYARPDSVARDSTLSLKLYWRARAPIAEDYTIFVHLVNANGKIIAQQDAQPQRGAYPTSFWDAGEIVTDEYALAIPRDASRGEYHVRVGIYRVSDGARLTTRDGDFAMLTTVRVVP